MATSEELERTTMGVDISTYRCRIGTFRNGPGLDVVLLRVDVNYGGCMRAVGAVAFIGILLIMAGVEANPGPLSEEVDDISNVLKKISLDKYIPIFEENMIGVNEVGLMSKEDFHDIGIKTVGIRLRITQACKQHLEDMKQKPVCKQLPDDKVDLQSSMQGLEGQIQPENLENKPADDEEELAQLRSKDGECKSKEKVKYQLTEGKATVTAVTYTPHSGLILLFIIVLSSVILRYMRRIANTLEAWDNLMRLRPSS